MGRCVEREAREGKVGKHGAYSTYFLSDQVKVSNNSSGNEKTEMERQVED